MPFNIVNVAVETVSPLFLSGNDQKGFELRASSIRGQLRYWYRSLLGGLGILEPKRLHELESKVFGMEERGSPIFVRLRDFRPAGGRIRRNQELDIGYDKAKKVHRHRGLTYLLYSTQLGGNERLYADPGSRFTIELSSFDKEAEKCLLLAASALWCWVHLGGVGTRSRRGAGNIQAKFVDDIGSVLKGKGLPDFPLDAINDPEGLKSHIEKGLKNVRGIVAELNKIRPNHHPARADFPSLHPIHTDIWVIQDVWKDVITAMDNVGIKFQESRYKRAPDFPSVLDYLDEGECPDLERTAFGLPLQFRYRSAPEKRAVVEAEHFTRRSSPLHLRFLLLGNGKASLLLLHFKSHLLPEKEMVRIKDLSKGEAKKPQKPQLTSPPSLEIRQRIIEEFRDKFSGYLDVREWL